MTLYLAGPEDTIRLGMLLGQKLPRGALVALVGNLGAGKTCLTKGLARGLGVHDSEAVVSPTYTLANEYRGRMPLYHLDVYRLEAEDFFLSGLDEYFCKDGITAVEWAEKLEDDLPVPRLQIELTMAEQGGRKAAIRSIGREFDGIIEEIMSEWS